MRKVKIISKKAENSEILEIHEDKLVKFDITPVYDKNRGLMIIGTRKGGELSHQSIFLSNEVNWEIVEDSSGTTCLVCWRD